MFKKKLNIDFLFGSQGSGHSVCCPQYNRIVEIKRLIEKCESLKEERPHLAEYIDLEIEDLQKELREILPPEVED